MKTYYHQECLKKELDRRIANNPRYSLRSFAKSFNLDSGALSKIMNGKRSLSYKMSLRFFEILDLSEEQQKDFLLSAAQLQRDQDSKRKDRKLRELLKKDSELVFEPITNLSHELFKVISDWYHYAILQLVQTDSFNNDPRWMASQLKCSISEINLAISRLKKLELLEEVKGKISRSANPLRTSNRASTTSALRKRQKQILNKSIESLENDPISMRNHTAMTMSIDPELIPVAKEKIEGFMEELSSFLESKSRKKVYELAINLFPLQRGE